ncbi:MAG TPA: hypothetical protein VGG10_02045 [Rhizomicrobium sp.]
MNVRAGLFAFACSLVASVAPALAHELTNGRITVIQADNAPAGYNTTTNDRVDSISWINSKGASTGNLVAAGGPVSCGDPSEFFGQSYSDVDGGTLIMVFPGATSTWKENAAGNFGTATVTGDTCLALSGLTTTQYFLTTTPSTVNAMEIRRTFQFNTSAASESYNLRAYVPRLPLATYGTVLIPNHKGKVKTMHATSCPTSCKITDWNGTWVAQDDGGGNGIVLIRDKASTAPAAVSVDYDGYSASNNTSILLLQPAGGFKSIIVETEWLCFYDTTSWPQGKRNKGVLPAGCKVSTPAQ